MSEVKESLKRGLKRGLILVGALLVLAAIMAGFQMLTKPNNQQPTPNRGK